MGPKPDIPWKSSSFVSFRMIGLIMSLKSTGRSEQYLYFGFITLCSSLRATMFLTDSSIVHYFDNTVSVVAYVNSKEIVHYLSLPAELNQIRNKILFILKVWLYVKR